MLDCLHLLLFAVSPTVPGLTKLKVFRVCLESAHFLAGEREARECLEQEGVQSKVLCKLESEYMATSVPWRPPGSH